MDNSNFTMYSSARDLEVGHVHGGTFVDDLDSLGSLGSTLFLKPHQWARTPVTATMHRPCRLILENMLMGGKATKISVDSDVSLTYVSERVMSMMPGLPGFILSDHGRQLPQSGRLKDQIGLIGPTKVLTITGKLNAGGKRTAEEAELQAGGSNGWP